MIDFAKKALSILPSLIIITIAVGLSYYWLTNKPKARRNPAQVSAPLVDVITPVSRNLQTRIHALGNVIPSQSVNLNSRVDGMVMSVSRQFIEGGLLKKGEEIVRLDPTDYELKVRQAESELTRARFNLKLELGQQAIAKREFEMLGQELDALATELVQRKPHLEAAKASVRAAEAALERTRLDLQRTRTIAPFNAIVTARNANIGSWVSTFSTGTPLVKLVATDEFWIDVSVPVDKLRWLFIPGINAEQGSAAKISYDHAWGPGVYRTGEIKRLKAEVEPEGRMAKLIVEVKDPLSLLPGNQEAPTMMLGTLVRLELAGKALKHVVELPEASLHDGRYLWLFTESQTLDILDVQPVWTEPGQVYFDSHQLPENARVIVSDLPTPVKGMRLRIHENDADNLIR